MKQLLLYAMAIAYCLAGINHFINPGFYFKIMPSFLPYKLPLIYVSGFFEVMLGVLLLFTKTRRLAAWGLIVLLIAIFPANLQMAYTFWKENNPYLWVALARLPLQLVFIYWAYIFTKPTE